MNPKLHWKIYGIQMSKFYKMFNLSKFRCVDGKTVECVIELISIGWVYIHILGKRNHINETTLHPIEPEHIYVSSMYINVTCKFSSMLLI